VESGSFPGVVRIDLEGLEQLSDLHRQRREAEVPKVEAVIARELHWLLLGRARHQTARVRASPQVELLTIRAGGPRRSWTTRVGRSRVPSA
jgi:glutamyl-tRNA reductase